MHPVLTLFCDLVKIPSPSGLEKDFSSFVQEYIAKRVPDAEIYHDNTGAINNSNSGNLVAHLTPHNTGPRVAIVTHMDTVEDGEMPVHPVIGKEYVTSKGDTILGADNKAGIAAMLQALDHAKEFKNINLTYILVTRGEKGVFGSGLLDPDMMRSFDLIISLESSEAVGTIVSHTVGYHHFRMEMRGNTTMVAMDKGQGVSGIQAMCKAVSRMELGSISDNTHLNIGSISGGTGSNMIPDTCTVEGELRSFSIIEMNQTVTMLKSLMDKTAQECGTMFLFHDFEKLPPYLLSENHRIIRQVEEILNTVMPISKARQRAFNDINILAQYGPPCMNIARGGEFPHTYKERIKVSDLIQVTELLTALFIHM